MIEYKKFTDIVSYSTLQLPFKKILLVEFWCSIKGKCPQLAEKSIKMLLSFPTVNTYIHEAGFSSHILTKTTYCQPKEI